MILVSGSNCVKAFLYFAADRGASKNIAIAIGPFYRLTKETTDCDCDPDIDSYPDTSGLAEIKKSDESECAFCSNILFVMKCGQCGSANVYRSHRLGLKEGLWLRMLLRAPYRCHGCGARFYARRSKTERGGHERSLAEYLGLRGREYSLRKWLVTAVITLMLLVVSIAFLLRIID